MRTTDRTHRPAPREQVTRQLAALKRKAHSTTAERTRPDMAMRGLKRATSASRRK